MEDEEKKQEHGQVDENQEKDLNETAEHEECKCGCREECSCGDECECGCEDHECDCHEHENSHHHEHHHHGHHHDEELAGQYLAMAQRLQADFDNYRKRVAEQLDYQREEGKKSVIEVFLPCLDTFKEAKKSIGDEKVLSGVNMIEEKILNALKNLHVEKIETVGQKFDHNSMEVIAVFKDESKEEDIVLDEFQAGYTLNGKVIRYAKVIVNKL